MAVIAEEPEIRLEHAYQPLPYQLQAHSARAPEVLFGAAVGVGKSKTLVEQAFAVAMKWAGVPVLIGRYRQIDLQRTTLQEWMKSIEPHFYAREYGGAHEKATDTFRLINGSTVYFAQLKDWNRWMSAELGWIGIEEANELPETVPQMLQTRLRWTTGKGDCQRAECKALPSYQPHPTHPYYQMFYVCNPNPGWLKRNFWDLHKKGKLPPNRAFIPARTRQNPYLPPSYIENLYQNHDPAFVARLLEGDWDAFEGAIFSNFNAATHVWDALEPYKHLITAVYGGIDWGHVTTYAHRTCAVLVARLKGGDYLAFWEYSKQGPASEDFHQVLANMTREWNVRTWFADPTQPHATRALRTLGIPIQDSERTHGSRSERVNNLLNLFAIGKRGRPRLMIHEDLTFTRDAIESYKERPEAETARGTGPIPFDPVRRNDDEVDALGYAMMGADKNRSPVLVNTELNVRHGPAPKSGSAILQRRREEKHRRISGLIAQWESDDDGS